MGSEYAQGVGFIRTFNGPLRWESGNRDTKAKTVTQEPLHRNGILHRAAELISGDRQSDYGDVTENHQRIADLWSVILKAKVTPEQVIMCMIALKLARLTNDATKQDSWIDIAGYAALGGEMTGGKK